MTSNVTKIKRGRGNRANLAGENKRGSNQHTSRQTEKKTATRKSGTPVKRLPRPPEYLDDVGKAEFARLGKILIKENGLDSQDIPALEMFAACFQDWLRAELSIQTDGRTITAENGVTKTNPACAALVSARTTYAAFSDRFGLNPAGRKKMGIEPEPEKPVSHFSW